MDAPPPIITSPQAPDIAAVRKWIEEAIAALRFRELVIAVIWLITRLRDLNTEIYHCLSDEAEQLFAFRGYRLISGLGRDARGAGVQERLYAPQRRRRRGCRVALGGEIGHAAMLRGRQY